MPFTPADHLLSPHQAPSARAPRLHPPAPPTMGGRSSEKRQGEGHEGHTYPGQYERGLYMRIARAQVRLLLSSIEIVDAVLRQGGAVSTPRLKILIGSFPELPGSANCSFCVKFLLESVLSENVGWTG